MRGYRADTAFDGERALSGGALVLVEDGRIVAVEAGAAAPPADCEVTYLAGTTILPGLIDTHVHLCGDDSLRALDQFFELSPADLERIIAAGLQQQLAADVTCVRDLGDFEWAVVDRRRAPADGQIEPTVVASGPPITIDQGHCWPMGGVTSGVDGLRAAVRERVDRGADVVKIMTSGGAMTPGTDVLLCQFTVEELRVVVEEAHRLGLPVTGHAHSLPAVQQCADAELDGIEHCSCLTPDGFNTPPELAERIAAAGTFVGPTLGRAIGSEPPPQVKAMMERMHIGWDDRLDQVRDLHRAGVQFLSGSDSGISPGKPHGVLPEAVIDLLDCGVPAELALTSATTTSAAALGLTERTGRLQAGLDADLLIVEGNPLQDITALRSVRTVVSRGREVDLIR